MDHAVFGSPSQTVTVLRCMKMMIFTLGLNLNVHSSACKFNDFVMNKPDNCSFNDFFFSSILLPIALLSLAIVGFIQVNTQLTTLLCFLENQQSDGLQCSQGCDLYLLSKEIQINNVCKLENTI